MFLASSGGYGFELSRSRLTADLFNLNMYGMMW